MRQPRDEAHEFDTGKARHENTADIARDEQAEQAEQERAAGQAGAKDRNQRCANDNTHRIGRDRPACLRNGDVQGMGEFRQQSHHGEFAGSDGESRQHEGQHGRSDTVGWAHPFDVERFDGVHKKTRSGNGGQDRAAIAG